mgnify:FL=1|jgi:hypothetical protein
MSEKTLVEKLGGRKSAAFYACLLSMLVLALVDKAETHILGLIDTLFLVYAGANVAIKPKQLDAQTERAVQVVQPKTIPNPQTSDSMEKP